MLPSPTQNLSFDPSVTAATAERPDAAWENLAPPASVERLATFLTGLNTGIISSRQDRQNDAPTPRRGPLHFSGMGGAGYDASLFSSQIAYQSQLLWAARSGGFESGNAPLPGLSLRRPDNLPFALASYPPPSSGYGNGGGIHAVPAAETAPSRPIAPPTNADRGVLVPAALLPAPGAAGEFLRWLETWHDARARAEQTRINTIYRVVPFATPSPYPVPYQTPYQTPRSFTAATEEPYPPSLAMADTAPRRVFAANAFAGGGTVLGAGSPEIRLADPNAPDILSRAWRGASPGSSSGSQNAMQGPQAVPPDDTVYSVPARRAGRRIAVQNDIFRADTVRNGDNFNSSGDTNEDAAAAKTTSVQTQQKGGRVKPNRFDAAENNARDEAAQQNPAPRLSLQVLNRALFQTDGLLGAHLAGLLQGQSGPVASAAASATAPKLPFGYPPSAPPPTSPAWLGSVFPPPSAPPPPALYGNYAAQRFLVPGRPSVPLVSYLGAAPSPPVVPPVPAVTETPSALPEKHLPPVSLSQSALPSETAASPRWIPLGVRVPIGLAASFVREEMPVAEAMPLRAEQAFFSARSAINTHFRFSQNAPTPLALPAMMPLSSPGATRASELPTESTRSTAQTAKKNDFDLSAGPFFAAKAQVAQTTPTAYLPAYLPLPPFVQQIGFSAAPRLPAPNVSRDRPAPPAAFGDPTGDDGGSRRAASAMSAASTVSAAASALPAPFLFMQPLPAARSFFITGQSGQAGAAPPSTDSQFNAFTETPHGAAEKNNVSSGNRSPVPAALRPAGAEARPAGAEAYPASVNPRLGQITLLAPPLHVASEQAEQSGAVVRMDWKTLAGGSGPLDAGGMARLKAVLPSGSGAQFIYPALPEGAGGPNAATFLLSPPLVRDLMTQGYGPKTATQQFADAAVRRSQAVGVGSPASAAPLAASLVPSAKRPIGSGGGGILPIPANDRGGGGAKGAGMLAQAGGASGTRGGTLDFLGMPVRLAPSLGGRSELAAETSARSGDPSPSGSGQAVRPQAFGPLRSRLFPSFQSVTTEPDEQAWRKAAPSFGMRDGSPTTLLAPDARQPVWTPSLPAPQTETVGGVGGTPFALPPALLSRGGGDFPIGSNGSAPLSRFLASAAGSPQGMGYGGVGPTLGAEPFLPPMQGLRPTGNAPFSTPTRAWADGAGSGVSAMSGLASPITSPISVSQSAAPMPTYASHAPLSTPALPGATTTPYAPMPPSYPSLPAASPPSSPRLSAPFVPSAGSALSFPTASVNGTGGGAETWQNALPIAGSLPTRSRADGAGLPPLPLPPSYAPVSPPFSPPVAAPPLPLPPLPGRSGAASSYAALVPMLTSQMPLPRINRGGGAVNPSPGLMLQRSPLGSMGGGAKSGGTESASAPAKSAGLASGSEGGASAAEVQLLASEVFGLLKRRLIAESERQGRW